MSRNPRRAKPSEARLDHQAGHRSGTCGTQPSENPLVASLSKPVYTVQVRALVEFAWRGGDLGGGRDFVGSRRALAGTRGHQRVQRSRPAGYQKEVPVVYQVETESFVLRIQGRLDGIWAGADGVRIEEIKTVQADWDRQADPLHWAQVKCYGFIYAQTEGLDQIDLQLTYLELETGEVTECRERFSRQALAAFFEQTVAVYLDWVRARHAWCRLRDESIRALAFPFPRYRPGQRELAVAAYRTCARGGRLFLAAPTGIGKTVSVLFPAVKALGKGKLERIFYLTARTVGRAVAEEACADLRQAGLRLRAVTLTAKAKVCVREGSPCDPRTCPLALGYYDRCRAAMRAALAHEAITRTVLEAVGREHQVCPFELSLDVSSWTDAVVCDYNYVFDPQVYLRRHFREDASNCVFLVDEAHNLVDRARAMFSADLTTGELRDVRRAVEPALPRCARSLTRLSRAMQRRGGSGGGSDDPFEASEPGDLPDLFARPSPVATKRVGPQPVPPRRPAHDQRSGVQTSRELPEELRPLLDDALEQAENWLARNQPASFREDLLELYFRLLAFRRTTELYDERYVTITEPGGSVRLRLFCLDPSLLLGQALARGRAAVFFSATLAPVDYYRSLLGGRPEDPVLELRSPFPANNLAVLVHGRLRTTLKARTETLGEVVEAVGAVVQGRTGNYLVYLPSYDYLAAVQERFHAQFPDIALRVQRPEMSEPEREAFLAAFAAEDGRTLVGFAVLGGVFGEGIDLVGERLIGAISVGVGLPQLCMERDLIRDFFQERTGAGFDYAYTFPGMNRVLQAMGRVIRSEADRGVLLLIDTRFAEARYGTLFPPWWQPTRVRTVPEIQDAVRRFWQSGGFEAGPDASPLDLSCLGG